VDATISGMEETHRGLQERMLEAKALHTEYASVNDVTFEVGNTVWLSTRHCQMTRPSKTLGYERNGPYTVSKIVNQNAYKLDFS
jgi:hypothetical protein